MGQDVKVLVIGGIGDEGQANAQVSHESLDRPMAIIGREVVQAGHHLLVCSPFPDSADVHAFLGAVQSLSNSAPVIEFHYPDERAVHEQLNTLATGTMSVSVSRFTYPTSRSADGEIDRKQSWLFCQLAALDRSHAVVALGGKRSGPAGLLLHLADNRRHTVLPFTFLGGAAADAFERRRYEIQDRLGPEVSHLADEAHVRDVDNLLQKLVAPKANQNAGASSPRYFISYSRARYAEADFVEMTLRRRGCDVFRDDKEFSPGQPLEGEVREHIYRANVCIVLWCAEYACSPWCFDELELALQRQSEGKMAIWILSLDKTRIVPPRARGLLYYQSNSRAELERDLLSLVGGK